MMERPPGLPLGQPSQSMERLVGLPGNPAQGRRAVVVVPPTVTAPPPSQVPTLRQSTSNSSLTASAPIAASQVVALAREAMKKALEENETQAAEASGVSNELKPGVTVNLSHKNIQKLPEEVVDIIKDQLERLALSHNKLSSFPARFSECTSLRYLNVRNNRISEFPLPLCELKSLEILDLGRNQLRVLPPDIAKLTSLKVFAVQKNQIQELPLCLGDMVSLQMIKLDGNPLIFPPKEVLQVQASSPPNEGFLKDSEVTEVTVTAHIKKFLKQRAQSDRAEADAVAEESSEGTETPRMPPIKRVASGRFPIKVNGNDVPDLRSPALSRPPPIPSRSHYRGLSQQNPALRRPSVMPLTIGNVNERVRSNSETLLPSRAERPTERQRRMEVMSKKAQELGTLDETQANNRFSHYRGLSHGSAMQVPNGGGMAGKSPVSPAEPFLQRPIYVRRLSVLPERKRESKFYDPIVETAKGVLYSVFQIHPMIQMLMSLVNDGTSKRSSLEIVFYNTNVHVEELEQEIQKHDPAAEGEGPGQRENENVQRACITLVNAYVHVCSLLANNVDTFVDNGDPRYIRTLLTLLYNSIMELRVTVSNLPREAGYRRAATRAAFGDTLRPHSRENSVTPTAERPVMNGRPRNGTFIHNPSNLGLRVATDVPIPSMPYINGTGRTATITSVTPRSGESFASISSRGISADVTDEDRMFDKIYLSLKKSSDLVMRTLPQVNNQFAAGLRNSMTQRAPNNIVDRWRILIGMCNTAIQQTEMLQKRLSAIKLNDPGIRSQTTFWILCGNFIDSWAEFGRKVKEFMNKLPLPLDTRTRLRPIQQSMKETTDLIVRSPWAYSVRSGAAASATSPYGSQGLNNPVQLPMTPQSAALGPAVQATVPSTPQSGSFAAAFNGNVFERADALISTGGLSMPSRTGTMTSTSTYGLSSINSTLSSAHDGVMTPNSMLSPAGQVPYRFNVARGAF